MKTEQLSAIRSRLSFEVTTDDLAARGIMIRREELHNLIERHSKTSNTVFGEVDEPFRPTDMSESAWQERRNTVDDKQVGFAIEIRRRYKDRCPNGVHLTADVLLHGPKQHIAKAIIRDAEFKLLPRLVRRPDGMMDIVAWDMVDA
ncbi:hypothetical protein [Stenotrophomonas sp. GD03657]|uniref:hypothetical protein n=1 Tax=Stenotrophomonas sp. GD03657 TaxID=2975363 RepID=UPI00244BD398|nr:hypothetical protein [Stenotrophomonas sp. GD03657]MDH2154190.1 hypothetical protein [Stenotrophomonas sp. GD03657]